MRYDNTNGTAMAPEGAAGIEPRPTDLVFDYAGKKTPDLGGLTLLLTARMLADLDDRKVWVRSLPDQTWQMLHALGLDHMFELFPNSGELVN